MCFFKVEYSTHSPNSKAMNHTGATKRKQCRAFSFREHF